MDSNLTRLTVLFEAPFWVGIFERIEGNTLSVCFRIWRCIRFGFAASGRMAAATDGLNRRRLGYLPALADQRLGPRCVFILRLY